MVRHEFEDSIFMVMVRVRIVGKGSSLWKLKSHHPQGRGVKVYGREDDLAIVVAISL